MVLRFLILFLIITFAATAQTNYYVDNLNGSDDNSGLSLSQAWKSVQKACNSATPNSIIHIKGGIYLENLSLNVSGTLNNFITFRNFENDDVFIDGTGTSGMHLLRITNKSFIKFENLIFRNLIKNTAKGIIVETTGAYESEHLYFNNISIHNIQWTENISAVPVSGNNARAFSAIGRVGGIENLYLQNCKVFNNATGNSEAVTLNGNISGFLIENCIVHDNTNIGISLAGNYGACPVPGDDHTRNGIVRGNVCYNNVSAVASSAGIYVDGGHNITIEKNTSYQNGLGIEVGCEPNGTTVYITVKNNMIFNNLSTGLSVGGYNSGTTGQVLYCTFRNNTLFQNDSTFDSSGEVVITKASHCVFEDNIYYTNSQNLVMTRANIDPQINNIYNYNCWQTPSGNANLAKVYWGTAYYANLASFKAATLHEINSIYSDPGFVSPTLPFPDLSISADSQIINMGNPMLTVTLGETDHLGDPRIMNGIIDIGAREIASTLQVIDNQIGKSHVYPNPLPSNSELYSQDSLIDATFILYSLDGKEVFNAKNISGNSIPLHKLHILPGVYIYKILHGLAISASGKLIIK